MSQLVAISVKSMNGLDSPIDPRFGRAYAFLIVELETRRVSAEFFNNAASAAVGSGTAAAVAMKFNQVCAVISGTFGPKAFQSLQIYNIAMWTAPEGITAKEAIDRFAAGRLEEMEMKIY